MKHNHSFFLILAIIITIFVAAVYGYMYYMVIISVQHTAKAQLIVDSARLAKEREGTFLDTYISTADKWASLQNFFVQSNKVVDFIEAVELLSNQSGAKVTISSIEADNLDNAPVGKEGTVRLRMNASGYWPNVMRALSLAENLPFKVTVNNVSVNTSNRTIEPAKNNATSTPTKPIWNMTFDLQAAMISVASSSPTIK